MQTTPIAEARCIIQPLQFHVCALPSTEHQYNARIISYNGAWKRRLWEWGSYVEAKTYIRSDRTDHRCRVDRGLFI